MDDEINLDTDEDRGFSAPNVKTITKLGGTPRGQVEVMTQKDWDEFLPPAR
jgi:hypothetical protein